MRFALGCFVAFLALVGGVIACGDKRGVQPVDDTVYIFDDADAGVRCYGVSGYRWSCVKVSP